MQARWADRSDLTDLTKLIGLSARYGIKRPFFLVFGEWGNK